MIAVSAKIVDREIDDLASCGPALLLCCLLTAQLGTANCYRGLIAMLRSVPHRTKQSFCDESHE